MNNFNFLIFLHLLIDDDCGQITAIPTGQDEVLRNQPLLVVTDGGPGVLARGGPAPPPYSEPQWPHCFTDYKGNAM